MYASLMADLIAVRADPAACIDLAERHGFAGIDLRLNRNDAPMAREAVVSLKRQIDDAGLRPGYCSILPNKFSADRNEWNEHRKHLDSRCATARTLGFTRTCAVVLPFHPTLEFDAAMDEHLARLNDVLPIFATYGIALGLEYVSPLTRRAGQPNPFVYTLAGMLELIAKAGHPENLGLLLDSFHWHCANETQADLATLPASRIVGVHINDAIANRPTEQQRVDKRELPGATGVIDLAGFMQGLKRAGYQGPVTSEPTHPRWRETEADDAVAQTSEAVRAAVALAQGVEGINA
ncbi:MAG: sugar phosphate isomerase/epimerase family protein [Planctomycetota bacterium]